MFSDGKFCGLGSGILAHRELTEDLSLPAQIVPEHRHIPMPVAADIVWARILDPGPQGTHRGFSTTEETHDEMQ